MNSNLTNIAPYILEFIPLDMLDKARNSNKFRLYIKMQNAIEIFIVRSNINNYDDALQALSDFVNDLRSSENNQNNYALFYVAKVFLSEQIPSLRTITMDITRLMNKISQLMGLENTVFYPPPNMNGGKRKRKQTKQTKRNKRTKRSKRKNLTHRKRF